MVDDIAQARLEVAATRDRIDRRLAELGEQIPNKDEVTATAVRIGAAVGASVVAIGGLVLFGKRRGSAKSEASQARAYAEALVSALPEVAEAYVTARDGVAAASTSERPAADGGDDGRSRGTLISAALLAVGAATGLVIARRGT